MVSIRATVRELRQKQTPAEKVLWEILRNRKLKGEKFVRQYPIIFQYENLKRFFVADFCCVEQKLMVEIDGKIHLKQKERDADRTFLCEKLGYRVIRFTNEEMLNGLDEVLERITELIM